MDRLTQGHCLESELPLMRSLPGCVRYINSLLYPMGRVVIWRYVRRPSRFGDIRERLYRMVMVDG